MFADVELKTNYGSQIGVPQRARSWMAKLSFFPD
jgi:hypothetical protein